MKGNVARSEICDPILKDFEQIDRNQWKHQVKQKLKIHVQLCMICSILSQVKKAMFHPKLVYNRPPLRCQNCQLRFFKDLGLERHLLGSHGLVSLNMLEAAVKGQERGHCPVRGCDKVDITFQNIFLCSSVMKRIILPPFYLFS